MSSKLSELVFANRSVLYKYLGKKKNIKFLTDEDRNKIRKIFNFNLQVNDIYIIIKNKYDEAKMEDYNDYRLIIKYSEEELNRRIEISIDEKYNYNIDVN